MWDHDEKATLRELFSALTNLVHLASKALQKYLTETTSNPTTTLKGDLPMNYQLNTADTVVVTITDTVDATGLATTIDPGSLTATLSDTTDSVSVSGSTVTLTGGTNAVVVAREGKPIGVLTRSDLLEFLAHNKSV